jgi:ABC-type antimicrobial peptide transport system permease subunit
MIGALVVEYLSVYGLNFGDTASVINSTEFAIGQVMYAAHSFVQYLLIALIALIVTLLGSLYPAWVATQKEPIEALRAL